MSEQYKPIPFKYTPASIPQIVAHIQKWLLDHPYVTEEDIIEIITTALEEHPEYINGSNIPISADDTESIKSYIDSLPALDAYTKSETDTLLSGKEDTLTFDTTPTADSTNPVTSGGIKTALDNATSAVDAALALKADKSDTYTKTQVDNALLLKADADNVYSKNTIDAKFEALDLDVDAIDSAIERMDGEIDDIRENLYMISTDGNAPANMPAGDYIELNGNLYMLTADVSIGDLLIPGTNCVQILGGGLNRLGAGLKTQAQTINGLAAEVSGVEDAIAVVINGNTNTTGGAIAAGTYLFIKNHSTLQTGAYHATAAIASGESVTSSNTAADSDGIANALNAKLNTNSTDTSDILADAINVIGTKFFKAIGATYTGNVPNGDYKYGVFQVYKRNSIIYVIAESSSGIALNRYENGVWDYWREFVTSKLSQVTSGPFSLDRKGNIGMLHCFADMSAYTDGATITTLPEGYRPSATTDTPIFATNGTFAGVIRIEPSGIVEPVFGNFAGGNVRFAITYIIGS